MTPLSWIAQVAAHAAYVEARRIDLAPPAAPRPASHSGRRRSPAASERNRAVLLYALRDGKPHRFADLVAACPGLSRQGIYYLVDVLGGEGRVAISESARANRTYQLI